MKMYIAGKITGFDGFENKFKKAENELKIRGHKVLNPAILPKGFKQDEYMHICYSMIDVCDCVYFLDNWMDSVGAKLEYEYAKKNNKKIFFEQ